MCGMRSGHLVRFNSEAGLRNRWCHRVQNSCHENSVIPDGIFNPGYVAINPGIDTHIGSQNTPIGKRQDSLKYPVAHCWGSCDFLPGKRRPSYFSGKGHSKMGTLRYVTLQGCLLPGTMPTHNILSLMRMFLQALRHSTLEITEIFTFCSESGSLSGRKKQNFLKSYEIPNFLLSFPLFSTQFLSWQKQKRVQTQRNQNRGHEDSRK